MAPAEELPFESIDGRPTVPVEAASGDRAVFETAEIQSDSEGFWSGLRALSGDVRKAYTKLLRPASCAIPAASAPLVCETEVRESEAQS